MASSKQGIPRLAFFTALFSSVILLIGAAGFAQSCISSSAASARTGKSTISVAQLRVPDKARSELRDAKKLIDVGDSVKASAKLEGCLSDAPDYAEALTIRAFLKLAKNQNADALLDLQRSVRIDPSLAATYLGLGSTYNNMRRFSEALPYLKKCLDLMPGSWQCRFEVSRARLAQADYEEALEYVECASSLAGTSRDGAAFAFVKGYALIGLHQYEQGIAELQTFLSATSDAARAESARKTIALITEERDREEPNFIEQR